jgi:hypothetical protein
MAKYDHLLSSCHASVTRELQQQYNESLARWTKTVHQAKLMRIPIKISPPSNPMTAIIMQASVKAKHCKCGSLKCPTCGFVKLQHRIHLIEKRGIAKTGYLTGGRVNF